MNQTKRLLRTRTLLPLLLLAIMLVPVSAQAHFDVSHGPGFIHGFSHPLGGLDHLVAMVAVGLWTTQLDRRARWAVPLTFVAVMLLGSTMGTSGVALPFVEQGIASSLLVLGVLIAAAVRLSTGQSAAIVGVFALLHGYAHGVATPSSASGLYSFGLLVATALLHLNGIGIGLFCQQLRRKNLRLAQLFLGGTVTSLGVYFCLA